MKQVITYEVPDVVKDIPRWKAIRNRIALAILMGFVPLTALYDCYVARTNKAKNPFWQECAARWLYLAIVARMK